MATRPAERSGLGLGQADPVADVRASGGRMRLLDENEKVAARLLTLLDELVCTGKQAHDANIVAAMLVHGIDTLVTINVDDYFVRFSQHVRVRAL